MPRPIIWNIGNKHVTAAKIVHYVILPLILVGSDMFIGIFGLFTSATDGNYSWEAIVNYFTIDNLDHILLVLFISIVVVLVVEWIVRQHKK